MRKLPSAEQLHAERDALIQEIHAAFNGVSREGGVSWSESVVIDDYGTDEQRTQAREMDRERSWEELVDDPSWRSSRGVGGFSFLDAIGFRYYLAPAMIRCVHPEAEESMSGYRLTIPTREDELREHRIEQISLLNQRQRACVARFLQYMTDSSRHEYADQGELAKVFVEEWETALNSGWTDPATFPDSPQS